MIDLNNNESCNIKKSGTYGCDHFSSVFSGRGELETGRETHGNDKPVVADSIELPVAESLLNTALSIELESVLRYRRHAMAAIGECVPGFSEGLLKHASRGMEHANSISQRLVELGGTIRVDPARLSLKRYQAVKQHTAAQDLMASLLAEGQKIVRCYQKIIPVFDPADPITRNLLKNILRNEEEQVAELSGICVV